MDKDIAIKVENVSKTFKIPHEKVSSLRGAAVSMFSRNKGYEEFKALDDVSFEVKKGEFFGIIGRNGSGKSTLLKILAGIYQPDKGKVKINGRISPFLELGIGFNPELSGRDNVYLNATVLGLTKKEIDEKFDSIVKFSELERFIDQKLKNYSSGMQVRLAFSVSIHANREILLMDEVLAVGDANFQAKCLREFNQYKKMGKTVILVTHDISVVQRYCKRALLLRNGKIFQIGDANSVGDSYVSQNITDEEEKKPVQTEAVEDNHDSRDVRIVGIQLLNEKGENKKIFKTGELLEMEISYKINKPKKVLNFGVAINSAFSGPIFCINTKIDGYSVNVDAGKIKLKINKLSILQGEYYINIGCFGDNDKDIYDYKPSLKTFKIFSDRKKSLYGGIADLDHVWE